MSSPRTPRDAKGAPLPEAIPLRSFTVVWIGASLLGVAMLSFALKSSWSGAANHGAATQLATLSKGPTKRQVRERQEHIAFTERALDLARKERKAAQPAAAATPAAAQQAPDASAAESAAPGAGSTSEGARSSAATSTSASKAAPAPAAPADASAEKPAAPATKAPSSGLDEMRADIAAALE